MNCDLEAKLRLFPRVTILLDLFGLLVTFSLLSTETSEIKKVCFFGSCPGINVLTEQ